MSAGDLIMAVAKAVIVLSLVAGLIPILIWSERKGSARFLTEPNSTTRGHAGFRFDPLQGDLADVTRSLFREEATAAWAVRLSSAITPLIALVAAVAPMAIIPWTEPCAIGGVLVSLQIVDLRAGLVAALAMSSLGVYALLFAGGQRFGIAAFLGALRRASQMISAELAMGLAALALIIVAGSASLSAIIDDQGSLPWRWNAVRQPVAFVLFVAALLAETGRLSSGLPKESAEPAGDGEAVSGNMHAAMFSVGAYAHIVVGSMLMVVLFFGGWQVPGVSTVELRDGAVFILAALWPVLAVALVLCGGRLFCRQRTVGAEREDNRTHLLGFSFILLGMALIFQYALRAGSVFPDWVSSVVVLCAQLGVFLLKGVILGVLCLWGRVMLSRTQEGRLMRLCWKGLVPVGILNVLVTTALMLARDR